MKIKDKVEGLKNFHTLEFLIASITICYVIAYFTLVATPGNTPYEHPLGWWGWFDQGQYLKAAHAFLNCDFSADNFFYPPLYPALGALFLPWSSGHSYFLLNLFCLLWFAYVFIRASDIYIPRWSSIFILFSTTIFNWKIFENYLIPWTTTLSTALLASGIIGLIWLRDVFAEKLIQIRNWQVLFVAICLGLILPTRPADAVIGGLLGLALLVGYIYCWRFHVMRVPKPYHFLLFSIVGFIIGPTIYLAFNKIIFNNYLGNYFQISTGYGFFFADLAEKFVSLWLDGQTLYGEPGSGLIEHYPWLLISLAGMIWILLKGDWFLRILVMITGIIFFIYMPYGDLLPNGLWRYLNIHYFKWTFPFFGLFAWILVRDLVRGWKNRNNWVLPFALLIIVPGFLLTLQFTTHSILLKSGINAEQMIDFKLPKSDIDYIDIRGITGGFNEIYLGNHKLWIDGKELKKTRNFRLLPMGNYVRLLFIRPISGKNIQLMPDPNLNFHNRQITAYSGTYNFAFGIPKPLGAKQEPELVSGYLIGDEVDASIKGNSDLYVTEGWSGSEDWGRWSINKNARLLMNIIDFEGGSLILEITYSALVEQKQPCQNIIIKVNQRIISKENICSQSGGKIPMLYSYKLPPGLIKADRILDINIATPDSISPRELGINDDSRILGIGLKKFRIRSD